MAAVKQDVVGVVAGDRPKNQNFTDRFNRVPPQTVLRVPKIVIVNQDPASGDFVPAGTPVSVTVVEKGLIPIQSFTAVSTAVTSKYLTIGALEDDLGATDAVAVAAKKVLDQGLPFDQLSTADKAAVTNFVNDRKVAGSDAAAAASDISLLYQL